MQKLEKFIKSLELVKTEGKYDLGLVINKSGRDLVWEKIIPNSVKAEVFYEENEAETLKAVQNVFKSGRWLILELKDGLSAELYAQLRSLSSRNRFQYIEGNEIKDIKMPDKTRIVVEGLEEVLDKINEVYPEFKNIFGPIIEI